MVIRDRLLEEEELPVQCRIPLDTDSARSTSLFFPSPDGAAEDDARLTANEEENTRAFESLWDHLLAGLASKAWRTAVSQISEHPNTIPAAAAKERRGFEKSDSSKNMVSCGKRGTGEGLVRKFLERSDERSGGMVQTSGPTEVDHFPVQRAWDVRARKSSECGTPRFCTAAHMADPVQEGSLLALAELLEVSSYSEEMRVGPLLLSFFSVRGKGCPGRFPGEAPRCGLERHAQSELA